MPLVSAIELLEKIVGTDKVAKELYTLEAICDAVGRLPLAVELMGEYLKKNWHLTFAQVQHKLDRVLSQDRSQREYGHRGVAAALQLTWEALSEPSRHLAMFLSLFDRASIHWPLAKFIAESTNLRGIDLDEARGELDRLHFLRPLNEDCTDFTVHALVQVFCQDKLTEQPDLNTAYRRAFVDCLLAIAKQIPQTPTLVQIQAVAPAIPHLERLSQEFLEDISNPEEDLIWAFVGVASFYQGQGLYTLAEVPLLKCLAVSEQQLGANHPDTASSLNNLAELYRVQGRYSAAEPLYIRSLSIWEQQLGADHPDTAAGLNNLAGLYYAQGHYSEAELLYIRALSIVEQQLGANHPDTAASLNNLAGLYKSQGLYSEAEPLYKRSLNIREQQLGADHPDTASSLNNLAGLYKSQGLYSEAEPLYKRALSISKQLGANHPDTAISIGNLASLELAMERYEAAETGFYRALDIFVSAFCDDHPYIQETRKRLHELVNKAVQAGQTHRLSAHPFTQLLLGEIKVEV
jgi:tetratricopeptide (TPR) repeat protein